MKAVILLVQVLVLTYLVMEAGVWSGRRRLGRELRRALIAEAAADEEYAANLWGQARLLTDDELKALGLTADLANLFGQIVGSGRSRIADLDEAVFLIHGLQRMLLAQAAARAYPGLYRLLGEEVTSAQR